MADRTLIDELDDPPPWLCRLICVEEKKSGGGLPVRPTPLPRLVKRSKLTYRTFQRISWLSSFKGVPVDVISKFLIGCGLSPNHNCRRVQVMRILDQHGAYAFKLAPRGLSRNKLRALDAKYQRWCEARPYV